MKNDYELMKILEGCEYTAYKCTSGYVTIGVGFNMDSVGARDTWRKVGVVEDFDEVYNKESKLSEESSAKLFDKTWNWCKKAAEARCEELGVDYEPMASWHKFVLADIAYNTGSLKGWTKVVKETAPGIVLVEARRKPHEVMDSRVAKISHYFGYVDSVEDAVGMGLTHTKYIK